MKHHVVLKLHAAVPEPEEIPDWQAFITDKSRSVMGLTPRIDAVLHAVHREFWVTHEYAVAGDGWTEAERRHGLDRTYRLVLDSTDVVAPETLARLADLPEVEAVHQLVVTGSRIAAPERTTAMGAVSTAAESIGLGFAHALTSGRPDVKVAVLDTGISPDHPELTGVVERAYDFVDLTGLDTTGFLGDVLNADEDATDALGHGTHVAGIIAAQGVRMDPGVAPGCRLLVARVLATLDTEQGPQGAGIVDNINPAVKWAVDHGAAVINMSVGIRHSGGGLPHADVIAYALDQGVTVVAASGNDGTSTKYYPGALRGVVAVGACDDEGRVAPFTSYGARITVVAPGQRILSAYADQRYAVASGTSQASPYVAGAAALLHCLAADRGNRLAPQDIMTILRHTSDRVDARNRNEQAGYGRINLIDAFKWLLNAGESARLSGRTL